MGYCLENYTDKYLYFNVMDINYYSIYQFYSKNKDQKKLYDLDERSPLIGDLNLLHKFGIYESSYHGEKTREYSLLILKFNDFVDTITLSNKIEELEKENNGKFTHCIVEHDYRDEHNRIKKDHTYKLFKLRSQLSLINKDLHIFYEDLVLERKSSLSLEHYMSKLPQNVFVNLFPIMNKYSCNGVNTKDSIKDLRLMIDEILDMGNGAPAAIFYYKEFDNIVIEKSKAKNKNIYLQIAAYMIYKHGFKFIIPNEDKSEFYKYVDRLTSNQFMYMSDFLHMIYNPPEIGFIDSKIPCICIRDNRKMFPESRNFERDGINYGLDMYITYVEFDLETRQMIGNEAKFNYISYNYIELLNISDIFDVRNKNYEVAVNELNLLNKLIRKFEGFLVHSELGNLVSANLVDFTNTIIFKKQNKVYLGYVSHLTGKVPYLLIPAAGNNKPFFEEFSVVDSPTLPSLTTIRDINVLFDRDDIINKFLRAHYISGNTLHYLLPEYNKLSAMTAIPFTSTKLDSSEDATVEDIGIWSITTLQMRSYDSFIGTKKRFMENCDIGTLRTKNLITFYGGPHPSLCTKFSETPDMWR